MNFKSTQLATLFFLFMISTWQLSFAQSWEKEIEVPIGKSATTNRVKVLPDGSILKGAYLTNINGSGTVNQIQLTRIGINGVVYWNRFYEMPSANWYNGPWMFDLEATLDGTIYLAGTVNVGNDRQVRIWRLNASGQISWVRTFGLASRLEAVEDMTMTHEGDILISGTDQNKPFLLKVKPNGTQDWIKYINNSTAYGADGVALSANGNIAITGSSGGYAYLALLSPDAVLLWQNTYPYRGQNFGIAAMPDSSWVVCGNYIQEPSSDFDPFLMVTDKNGTLLWEHHEGPDNTNEYYSQVVVAQNGNIYVAGSIFISLNAAGLIARFDAKGNLLSDHQYGQLFRRENLDDLALLPDGGLVGAGLVTYNSGGAQGWVFLEGSEGELNNNLLKGKLFSNLDNNCNFDAGSDIPMPNRYVTISKGSDMITLPTDADGNYKISVDTGHFEITTDLNLNYWEPCRESNAVVFKNFNDSAQLDYPLTHALNCPDMTIDISTSMLRRCFPSHYTVAYCNNGTTTAVGAYVDIFLPAELTLTSSSIASSPLGANAFRFQIGDVAPLQCGTFFFTVQVGCDNVQIGDVLCVSAKIYPDTICITPNLLWSGAALTLAGSCDGDSVQFMIKNTGTSSMAAPKTLFVTRNADNYWQTAVLLDVGESRSFRFEANEEIWHAEIDQEPYFPTPSHPSATIDACNGIASNTKVLQFASDDAINTSERDCHEVIGSWDPNDKTGYPLGIGTEHQIRPNTELEYHIRFQNTGTDTAFTVVIRDTLSPFLQHSTLKVGASSHPFKYNIRNGVLEFVFNDILLPDSNVNEPASHGFINFRIAQKPGLPVSTTIYNRAGIYFDFNEAVLTNTTFHRITPVLTSVLPEPNSPSSQGRVQIYPNPGAGDIRLSVQNLPLEVQAIPIRLQFWRGDGTWWEEHLLNPVDQHLNCNNWPKGVYLFRAVSAGRILGQGKFLKL